MQYACLLYTSLERRKRHRQPSGLRFLGNELDDIICDFLGDIVYRLHSASMVWDIGIDDRCDLIEIARIIVRADPVVCMDDRDRL